VPFEPRIFGEWPADERSQPRAGRFAPGARFPAPARPAEAARDGASGARSDDDVLPDDLAEVAQQLVDESRLLGEKYPAGSTACDLESVRAAANRRPGRFARLRLAAAAAAAVIGLSMAVEIAYRAGRESGDSGTATGSVVAVHPGDQPTASPSAADSVRGAVVPVSLPAAVFSNLSGAEQEGVLDLMKDVALRVEI
jgi:hypothetical protein